jgi:hypothetical protein
VFNKFLICCSVKYLRTPVKKSRSQFLTAVKMSVLIYWVGTRRGLVEECAAPIVRLRQIKLGVLQPSDEKLQTS